MSQNRPLPFRRGFGSLFMLAVLFTLAALLRLGEGMGMALAFASETMASPAQACEADEGAMRLLRSLQERENALTAREGEIADRNRALAIADERIQTRLATLIEAENDLAKTLTIADSAAEDDITRLVSVYESMKPKQAAPLFAAMAPEFAAGFLARMQPPSAAAILAQIDPAASYAISVIVAGRNANAPKQ